MAEKDYPMIRVSALANKRADEIVRAFKAKGIDDKLYNHIFTGRRKPSKEVLEQLVDFFDDQRSITRR